MLRSVQEPERTFRTNVVGTNAVLAAGREAGVTSLAFTSTNAVTGPMTAPKISEAAALNPLTPYGSTKAAGEMLMSAYTASYGLRCACIRLTNVYGPGMQAKDSIVARLMRGIRLGTTFEIYGDGHQVRDYLHVSDVVAALKLGLTSERWSGPMVIGSGSRCRSSRSSMRSAMSRAPSSRSARPGQGRRDAGGDRRPEQGTRGRLGAAIPGSATVSSGSGRSGRWRTSGRRTNERGRRLS